MCDATIFLKSRVFWNYFESTSIIDEFDARPPVRQQFLSHHRKEDHTQFGPLGHNSFSVNQSDKVTPIQTARFQFANNAAIEARSAR